MRAKSAPPAAPAHAPAALRRRARTPSPEHPRRAKRSMPRRAIRARHVREAFAWLTVVSVLLTSAGRRLYRGSVAARGSADEREARVGALRMPVLHAEGAEDEARRARLVMHADYERRLEAATGRGRKGAVKEYVRWLHIPKTGTSFVNTLLRWGCTSVPSNLFVVPRKERPADLRLPFEETFSWDWLFTNQSGRVWLRNNCDGRLVTQHPQRNEPHYALYMHRAITAWEVTKSVAVFRLPLQRTYSNYLHLNLHYNETRSVREPLESFLNKTQFWSQQAKLLLGRHYKDKRRVTAAEAVTAAFLVRKRLKFVGLTEEFELTTRLFHAKFGGIPHRAQFENIRPGIHRYRSQHKRSSSFRYDESQFKGWGDPADEIVYAAARRRFWDDVKAMKAVIELDGLGKVLIDKDFGNS